jgi:hypothetical protein
MSNRSPLFHLLSIPILTFLACNPISNALLSFASENSASYLKNLAVMVTLLYGLSLQFFCPRRNKHWIGLAVAGMIGFGLSYLELSWPLWLGGTALTFSGMRLTLMEKDARSLPKDLVAFFMGLCVAVLVSAFSLTASVAGFFLVQGIFEMNRPESAGLFIRDRFRESYSTAEKILKGFT